MFAVRGGWLGKHVGDALLAHAQLGQAQGLLKRQQGIGSGHAAVLIHVTIRRTGLLST